MQWRECLMASLVMTSRYEPLPGLQMLYLPPRSFCAFLLILLGSAQNRCAVPLLTG